MKKGIIISRKIIVAVAALYLQLTFCFAQLTVNNAAPYNNTQYLVENVLLGTGVVASNFTFNGSAIQIGFFNGVNSNLGLDSGIVMSSGDIADMQPGVFAGGIPTGGSDADLLTVANSVPPLIGQSFTVSGTFDAAILEFDFVPSSDTVKFRYVFGSDEYQTYINSQYNDVFAFFLSGPGISGPYASPAAFPGGAVNIAVVPNSSPLLPITISSVQPNLNGQYYIDNPGNTTVGLNGFTTVLTAIYPVTCGQTYHIKLAIADGSDSALDSGVFLEANSFSSGTVSISAQPSYSTNSGDTILYEGCGAVTLTFTRTGNLTQTDTINYLVAGSATMGTDYTNIPSYVVFQPGQDTVTLSFTPFDDGVNEGMETVIINIINNSSCVVTGVSGINLALWDQQPLIINTTDTTMPCTVSSVNISTSVISGIPAFDYLWSTGDTTSSITVSPPGTTNYIVTVTDGCGIQVAVDTATVLVPSQPLLLSATNGSTPCPKDSVQISASFSGGYPPYQYWWSNGIQNDTSQYVSPNVTTSYTFFVVDQCGNDTDMVSSTVTVPVFQPIVIQPGAPDTLFCPGDPIDIKPSVSGGSGGYQFTWDNWVTQSQSLTVNPMVTTIYTIAVTDDCSTDTVSTNITVEVMNYPPLNLTTNLNSITLCPYDSVLIVATASGGSGVYSYSWSNFLGTNDSVNISIPKSAIYFVTVTDECNTKDTATINIIIQYPEAAFTYKYEEDFLAHFTNQSTPDSLTYIWTFGDGLGSTDKNPDHNYDIPNEYDVQLVVTNPNGCSDSITHRVIPPTVLWIPNAFTVNNDGLNDVFEVKATGLTSYEITIFDRWGDVVYTSDNIENSWDGSIKGGKLTRAGVYIYKISYTGHTKRVYEKMGRVTLVK